MSAYEHGRSVPMTPDGRITWQAYPTNEGAFYLPSDASQDVPDILRQNTLFKHRLGSGRYGRVKSVPSSAGNLVVKEFFRWMPGGMLADLKANVTLAAGLDEVQSFEEWDIKGVKTLGAFIRNPNGRSNPKTRWLMERICPDQRKPTHATPYYGVPDKRAMLDHYSKAVIQYGAEPMDFLFDEKPANLLLVRAPSEDAKGLVYKIDAMAMPR